MDLLPEMTAKLIILKNQILQKAFYSKCTK